MSFSLSSAAQCITEFPARHARELSAALLFREIEELKKELDRQKRESDEAKKALEDKVAEEMVQKGELDADEVSTVS